ncbi:MAG: prepilin-type N-terminal cleavage/methylation domain-containing protein [Gallionella sp.]|nr:prepilin-type N-terminal cleavage/methylation domain-containing protein [Gallionella sp.]
MPSAKIMLRTRVGQAGFSIIEAMVAALILGIAAFCFVGSQVMGMAMQKDASSRHAATTAGMQAMQPLIAISNQSRDAVAASLSAFPKSIYSPETRRTYQVTLKRVEDTQGNVVGINALPAHAVLTVALNVPYKESGQVQAVNPLCTVSY